MDFGLYMVYFGQIGHKPIILAFLSSKPVISSQIWIKIFRDMKITKDEVKVHNKKFHSNHFGKYINENNLSKLQKYRFCLNNIVFSDGNIWTYIISNSRSCE